MAIYHAASSDFNPITGGLVRIALKPFELLIYKLVTFPKYEFNKFSKTSVLLMHF